MTSNGTCNGFGVYEAKGEFKHVDVKLPPMSADDVELRISHCGVCHSDIHTVDDDWGVQEWPVVVGHEIIGIVTQVGSNVTQFKAGQRVGVGPQVGSFCFPELCANCQSGRENYCTQGMIKAYNCRRPDGLVQQGGYSEYYRCEQRFVIPIPDNLPSDKCAPLLCAGITTFVPLKYAQVTKGTRVAVVGIGGLGHMAVKLAAAMGAVVTAVSTSTSKEAATRQWGASGFVNSRDPEAMKAAKGSFDVVISTVSVDLDWRAYLQLLAPLGRLHLLGVPPAEFKCGLGDIIRNGLSVTGSLIGSPSEQVEMLELCSKHNILPEIEKVPWTEVNAAIGKVRDNTVRYRMVLEMETDK